MLASRSTVESQLREDLFRGVDIAVAAANPGRISALTYTAADNTSPDYIRLRQQFLGLGRVLTSLDLRWVYAVAKVGDETRFIVDSAADDDPGHSEPGVIYLKPPAAVAAVLADGQRHFAGPYTDEYGTYFSAFTAIRDNASRKVIGVMGADIDAAIYYHRIWLREMPLMAVTVLAVLLFWFSYMYLLRRANESRLRRERDDERLRHAREKEALLMNIGEGVTATDRSGRIVFINPAGAALLGRREDKVLGRDYRELFLMTDEHGQPLMGGHQPIAMALEHGTSVLQPSGLLSFLARADGTRFPVSYSVALVSVGDIVQNAVMTFRDRTEEADMDRMKTEFIAIASHQLKTPITALKWAVEMLRNKGCDRPESEFRDVVAQIGDVTEHMGKLVDSLLNVTRLESGRMAVEPVPTDLAGLAAEAVNEAGLAAGRKGQAISLNVAAGLAPINVDPRLIMEVMRNLLSNGVKYTPVGGKIAVGLAATASEIVVSVSDNGIGIPDADRKRIFQKFFRAGNISGLEADGTGLGLYFAKLVVEASGGRIWFEPAPAGGTTFLFALPLSGSQPRKGTAKPA